LRGVAPSALAWSSLRSSRKAFGLRPLARHALALLGLWARRRVRTFDRNGAVRETHAATPRA
jgi:hypothetical protein